MPAKLTVAKSKDDPFLPFSTSDFIFCAELTLSCEFNFALTSLIKIIHKAEDFLNNVNVLPINFVGKSVSGH